MYVSRRSFFQLSSAAALVPPLSRFLASSQPSDSELCRKLANDPLRPQYHLMPAHNWMNDPNGPIFYRGRYQMFYQYNPQAAVWGNMNWAHATSPDLIHWQHEPIAISPTPNGSDRDGVFSGSAVLNNGRPTMIYTGVAPPATDGEATLRDGHHTWKETQCLAVAADDDLRTWKKLADPVIAAPPAGLEVTGFRDPFVWRENGRWMLILGSGFRGKGGAILLYTSTDLQHWTYLHPLVEGAPSHTDATNPVDTGDMWECPDFFPLGNKHVLLISTVGKVRWKVGTYANERFSPEKEGVVDWGSYYAAKSMLDKDGNRILWGWIPEARPNADLIAAGWAGAMALPRVLTLNSENELQSEVHPAVQMLRANHISINAGASAGEPKKRIDELRVRGLSGELSMQWQVKDESAFHLQSDSGEKFATISVSSKSGLRELKVNNVSGPLAGEPGSPIDIRLLIDGSVLEVFANRTNAMTVRVYSVPSGPLGLRFDSNSEIKSLDYWQMKPISKDRLTGSLCGK